MRLHSPTFRLSWSYFNPRIPCGMRRSDSLIFSLISYFNPRIPCGMRLGEYAMAMDDILEISIHASRVGCDSPKVRSPRTSIFQSTHPVWDATTFQCIWYRPRAFQSTHPVWDATTFDTTPAAGSTFQSTHPVWDATKLKHELESQPVFQSTHPVWDATRPRHPSRLCRYFNPRIPCGMRRKDGCGHVAIVEFQSTHPVWDATSSKRNTRSRSVFQSTHPVWDATTALQEVIDKGNKFQSTHPVWDATSRRLFLSSRYFYPPSPFGFDSTHHRVFQNPVLFLSTHPLWDATLRLAEEAEIFIPPSPLGCDLQLILNETNFNPPIHIDATKKCIFFFHNSHFNPHPIWDSTLLL